jgi:hypothetical protein
MDLGQQLEELKQENLALKQQLQEPDLKAFEQIRELRTTHKKLTDEVKRVTTECVQLSFKIKQGEAEARKQAGDLGATREQLERTESELQSCRNDLQQRTAELEQAQAKIAQLEDEFGTLQQDLAAKVQLGQRLEQSLEEAQHQIADRNSAVQGHQDELARQKDELQRRQEQMESLQAELSQRELRIGNLERLVNDFKEQYLSGEYLAVPESDTENSDESAGGEAYRIMSKHLEGLMGVAGGAIVEQVYQLTCVPANASDSASLEMVYEALQDSAQTFAQGSEAEPDLPRTLQACWNELSAAGLLTSSAAPVADAPESSTNVGAEVEPDTASPSLEIPDSSEDEVEPAGALAGALLGLEAQETQELEPPIEQISAEAIAPFESLPDTESPEDLLAQLTGALEEHEEAPDVPVSAADTVELPAVEDLVVESSSSADILGLEVATEAADEVTEEDEQGSVTVPETDVVVLESEPTEAQSSETTELETPPVQLFEVEIEETMTDSVPEISDVAVEPEQSPSETVVGAFLELDLEEQLEVPSTESSESVEESAASAQVETASSSLGTWRGKLEALLACQQVLEQDPANEQALNRLVDALDSEAWTGRESEFEVYLARVAEDPDDGLHSFLEALTAKSMGDVFEHLERFGSQNAELKGVSEFLASTSTSPRADVIANELKSGVDGRGVNRDQVEEIVSEDDQKTVELLLESVYPKSGLSLPLPGPTFERRREDASPAAFVGILRQALRMVDYTVFDFDQLDVLSYDGDEKFLVDGALEPSLTLMFHAELDGIPAEEIRFLAYRKLIQLYLNSSTLSQLAESFDNAARKSLLEATFELLQDEGVHESDSFLSQFADTDGTTESTFDLLRDLYQETQLETVADVANWLVDNRLVEIRLDQIADHFAARVCGLGHATYATIRELLLEQPELFERIEQEGLSVLFADSSPELDPVRLRVQRLWQAVLSSHLSA